MLHLDLVQKFSHHEIEFDIAHDGLDGLMAIVEKKYDLILTDHHMPRMTGVEFVESMRAMQNSKNKETQVIFISGFIPKVRDLVKVTENTLFLEKPLNHESLHRNINMLLGV